MNPIAPAFFIFLAVIGWAFQARTQWITRFGIFSTLLLAMFVRYGVAVPFSDGVNPAVTHLAVSNAQLAEYYGSIILVYVFMFAGVLAVDRIWPKDREAGSGTTAATWPLILVAGAITVVVLVAWVVIPWRDFIDGVFSFVPGHTQSSYRAHRVQYGDATLYSSSAFTYIGSFVRFALAPGALWILYFHRRRSRTLLFMFWFLLAMLMVVGVLSGQKLPAILLLLGFGIAMWIEAGRGSILNWKVLAGAVVFVLVLIPALYIVQYPGSGYLAVLKLTFYRLTEEYSRVAQLRFVFYPNLHPFLYGLSSFVLRGAAHLVGINVAGAQSPETYIPTHSPGVGPSYAGTWNAGFFADAWADFGFFGVIGAALFVGIVVRLIDRWFESSGQGLLEKGTYTALCVSAIYISEVAMLTAMWTYGLLSIFIVYAVLRIPGWLNGSRRVKAVQKAAPV